MSFYFANVGAKDKVELGEVVDEIRDGMVIGEKIDDTSCHATRKWCRTHVKVAGTIVVNRYRFIKFQCLEGNGDVTDDPGMLVSGQFYSLAPNRFTQRQKHEP